MEIGCGDSVVPVTVELAAPSASSAAPLAARHTALLTGALNELFAVDDRQHARSGLYNALYQSDLELQSAEIADREATIRLTGRLRLGGVCDEPRVKAQLEQTARQFATVDRVSIYVDGVPLDELLGDPSE